MRELDKDSSGEIDYREFVRWLRGSKSSGGDRDSSIEPIGRGKAADTKPAPKLTISDRVATELREKFDAAIDSGKIKGYEEVFKAMDKDGNGRVSRREFEDGLKDLRVRASWCGCAVVCCELRVDQLSCDVAGAGWCVVVRCDLASTILEC